MRIAVLHIGVGRMGHQPAQRRSHDLGYEWFDILFRVRLGNLKSAWGIVVKSHFFMVWWDRTHNMYPTSD